MFNFNHVKNLYKIPNHEWNNVRDLYKTNFPQHILSYNTLQVYSEWMQANPNHNMTMYTSDADWKKHGTYVLVEYAGPRCNVLFNTLDPVKYGALLKKTLKCLPLERAFTLAAFVEQVRPIAECFLCELNVPRYEHCDTILYYLPQKLAFQLCVEPKHGYDFKALNLEDVKLIDDNWPHQYPGSDIFIANVIRHNITLGAYDKQNGQLCAWVMQEQNGTIGLLQVLDSYKRQGLGERLVCLLARLMANIGMEATATVMCSNRPSRYLFQKLGFKAIDRVYWYDKEEIN